MVSKFLLGFVTGFITGAGSLLGLAYYIGTQEKKSQQQKQNEIIILDSDKSECNDGYTEPEKSQYQTITKEKL